ncbi:methyltransferase-like protein 20 [Platysternon megacephalum]|uniref:Methyltransferase-like protein 20 n=1 Tax=Platysternon megacephalum TaxID=55544 RepID=A0A4D9E060_9SAUR|nr:methyltransferase-like protein 20 [Platysternon megacephalum]
MQALPSFASPAAFNIARPAPLKSRPLISQLCSSTFQNVLAANLRSTICSNPVKYKAPPPLPHDENASILKPSVGFEEAYRDFKPVCVCSHITCNETLVLVFLNIWHCKKL